MSDLKSMGLWLLLSLSTVSFAAQPNTELQSLHISKPAVARVGRRDFNHLEKRCQGTCVECFGDGYQECASASNVCYKPGDSEHGIESCSSSGVSNFTPPSIPEFCFDGDCVTCFGAGFQECSGDSINCYKPGDSKYGIESCSSSGSGSGTGSESGSESSSSSGTNNNSTSADFCSNGGFDCKLCFGSTYTPCAGSNEYCYDPNNATSICPGEEGSSSGGSSTFIGSASSGGSSTSAAGSSGFAASSTQSDTAFITSSSINTGASTETTSIGDNSGSGTASSNTGVSGSGTEDESTQSSSSSSTASASSGSQTSATSGGSNEQPAASTGGVASVREGALGVVVACFVASAVSAMFVGC